MPDQLVGVDTVKVTGKVAMHRLLRSRVSQEIDTFTGEAVIVGHDSADQILPSGPTLRLVTRDRQMFGSVEFSVPRFLNGHNAKAATCQDALMALTQVYGEASRFVDWEDVLNDLSLSRVDLVRDFKGVPNVGGLLDVLSYVPTGSRMRAERISDTRRYGAQTLRRGTPKRYMCSLYDKYTEVLHQAKRATVRGEAHRAALALALPTTKGQVRFEASIRRPVLREKGLKTVTDLTAAAALTLARTKFDEAGFGTVVRGQKHVHAVLEGLVGTDDYKHVPGVMGYLVTAALGLPSPHKDARTRARHKALAERLGLTPADLSFAEPRLVGLDFTTGLLVAA